MLSRIVPHDELIRLAQATKVKRPSASLNDVRAFRRA